MIERSLRSIDDTESEEHCFLGCTEVSVACIDDCHHSILESLRIDTDTHLDAEVQEIIHRPHVVLAELLVEVSEVTDERKERWIPVVETLTEHEEVSCLAHEVAACKTFERSKDTLLGCIHKHLLLLVIIVTEEQVWKVWRKVPEELKAISEDHESCHILHTLASEESLRSLHCLTFREALTDELLCHVLDAVLLVARSKPVLVVAERIVNLSLVAH